jgi:hypothetical protein
MVKRKVFDIVPPQASEPVLEKKPAIMELVEEKAEVKKKPVKKEMAKKEAVKKIRKPLARVPILIGASLVLVIVLSLIFIKAKAEVTITPVREAVAYQTEVAVAANQNQNDILGELIQAEKTVSQEFSATGQKVKSVKAQGTIRVYNNYSTAEQPLIINTRFISDSGKLFKTLARVVVPGQKTVSGKLVPGEIDVAVAAAEAGEDYNIGPATFSIPGFSGTPKYTAFYGKSSASMAGGSTQEVAQVTKTDLENAQKAVKEQALLEVKTDLDNAISLEEYVFLNEATSQTVKTATSSAKEGAEVEKFTFGVTVHTQALIFKKTDLEDFAKSFIAGKIASGLALQENTLNVGYSVKNLDKGGAKMTLALDLSGKIYQAIDENYLKEIIKGKKAEEIRTSLGDFPNIENLNIRLWPFWITRAPEDPAGIKIKLNLD